MMKKKKTKKREFDSERELQLEYAFEYGVNFKNRVIHLGEAVDELMFFTLDTALTDMEAENDKPITIKLNSYGGDLYTALGIIGRLQSATVPINIEGYGKVMSAATLILASANLNKLGGIRRLSEYAWFMYHEPSSYEGDQSLQQQVESVKIGLRVNDKYAAAMAKSTNKSKSFWLKTGVLIDTYFEAPKLIKLGVIDEIF